MEGFLHMATELNSRGGSPPPLSIGRPRWENLLLIGGVAVFWAGVLLKLFG
jgi:hypothetical protein